MIQSKFGLNWLSGFRGEEQNSDMDKNDQHSKICLPCNFEVNPITHFGVIALLFIKFSQF
jgi:hypothetical protein